MQSKDLRIGNWIEIKNSKGICTTVTESTFDCNIDKNYKAIPINEQWLVNFGFEFKGLVMSQTDWFVKEQKYKWRKEFRIGKHTHFKHWAFTMECVSPPTLSLIDLNYVHELQNLYFALTGEELELKSESKP